MKDLAVLEEKKQKLLNLITEEDSDYQSYLDRLDSKKLNRIKRSVDRYSTGSYAAAPLTCLGPDNCPFLRSCPVVEVSLVGDINKGKASDYPIGKQCLMEKYLVQQKLVSYVDYLNVDPDNPIEMSIANELALIDLYKNRCMLILSNGDREGNGRDFLLKTIVGFSESGERAENIQLHPLHDLIEKLEKRRDKWIERLMESRKSKAEMLAKVGGVESNSKVLNEIEDLKKVLLEANSNTTEELLLDDE